MKKRKSTKITYTTTDNELQPKLEFIEYFDWNTFEPKIFTSTTAVKISKDLIKWARKDTSLKVSDFFIDCGYHIADIQRLCEKFPIVERAYAQAKFLIGNRREKGGLSNDFNPGMIASSMSLYDPEWKALAEWKAKLNKDQQQSGTKVVIIEKFPTTEEVPQRLTPEEIAAAIHDNTEDNRSARARTS